VVEHATVEEYVLSITVVAPYFASTRYLSAMASWIQANTGSFLSCTPTGEVTVGTGTTRTVPDLLAVEPSA
jgi:hypothetical protein